MKRCIIIDDEKNARESLEKMIQRYYSSRMEVCGTADSIKESIELINKLQPDVVFLDIEMPRENGMQLFKYFSQPNFEVVFTTAYEQYAIKAIKYAALDYILKPINQIELGEAISKLELKDKLNKNTSMHIETLLYNLNLDSQDFNKVVLPKSDGYELEKVRNIIYCKADKNYCDVHTISNNKIVVSKSLKYVSGLLSDEMFFRIHKSYLVNLNYIKSLSRADGGQVVLENGMVLPVSVSHFKELLSKISIKND